LAQKPQTVKTPVWKIECEISFPYSPSVICFPSIKWICFTILPFLDGTSIEGLEIWNIYNVKIICNYFDFLLPPNLLPMFANWRSTKWSFAETGQRNRFLLQKSEQAILSLLPIGPLPKVVGLEFGNSKLKNLLVTVLTTETLFKTLILFRLKI